MPRRPMPRLRIFAALMIALLAVPAAPPRANAQSEPSAETMQAAKDLMAVMSVDTVRQMVSGLTNQIWPTIERQLRGKRSDLDQSTLSELRTEFENIQMRYMANVMADAPTIYARHFSAAELRDMMAFYKTPTGQKSLKVMPQVMTDVFAMIMPKMQGLQVQIMDAFSAVLRQRGINL
jgi:hypothetical protein